MDTTMKCSNCDREVGLVEFSTYAEAYFLKLMLPALATFVVGAITYRFTHATHETRGIIDETMAGLANNFSIMCPHCKQIDWYPASGVKPKKLEQKSEQSVS